MLLTEQPLLLFALIIVGMLGQLALTLLKGSKDKPGTGYRVTQALLILFWLGVGVAMIIGAVVLFIKGDILLGVSNLALGAGLAISGTGRVLEVKALQVVGMIILAVGPISVGFVGLMNQQWLAGIVSLLIGTGLLLSLFNPPTGSVGQIWMGMVIVLSSGLVFLSPLLDAGQLTLDSTVIISLVMALIGLLVVFAGVQGVLKSGSSKPAKQTG